MSWLLTRLQHIGKNQAGAARALGIPQQRVREIAKGLRRIQADEWEPLAAFLEWSVADLHKASGGMQTTPVAQTTVRNVTVKPSPGVRPFPFAENPIPVWSNRPGDAGVLEVERRIVAEVPRAEFLKHAHYSFAIEITQDDMSPAFERRDVAIINPDRAVISTDDVLLVKDYAEHGTGPFTAILRRLVGETQTHWQVRQFHPAKSYELAKSEWPRALHVAGKRSR